MADTFNERALATLGRLGARDAEVGVDGSFTVSPGTFDLLDVQVVEATNPFLRASNAFPYPDETVQFVTPMANNPLCDLLPCGLLGALGIQCCEQRTSWNDPRILTDAVPVRVPQATAYLNPFNARVEGDVRLRVNNRSEQGERCVSVECKCRAGTPPDCEPVNGSATASGDDNHRLVVDQLDEVLDEVRADFSGLAPDRSVDREASFTKSGALSTIEALLDILITGTIRVTANIDVTASVSWRGRSLSRQFDIDARVRLPVDNVNYRW